MRMRMRMRMQAHVGIEADVLGVLEPQGGHALEVLLVHQDEAAHLPNGEERQGSDTQNYKNTKKRNDDRKLGDSRGLLHFEGSPNHKWNTKTASANAVLPVLRWQQAPGPRGGPWGRPVCPPAAALPAHASAPTRCSRPASIINVEIRVLERMNKDSSASSLFTP